MPLSAADTEVATAETPSSRRLLVAFLHLGATAFGGPASVTRMRELVVVQKRWLSEEEFARNLALCQMLPGATAMQCAAGVGLRARGLPLPAWRRWLSSACSFRPPTRCQAVPWSIPHAAVALLAFAALRKRINVVTVMLAAGLALGVLLP